MSLSSQVIQTLQASTEVEVVDVNPDEKHIDHDHHLFRYAHVVKIVIAPRRPTTSAEELGDLLERLMPAEAQRLGTFRLVELEDRLYFGSMYVNESFGQKVRTGTCTVTITDPEFEAGPNFVKGRRSTKFEEVVDLLRHTVVHLYPSIAYAKQAIQTHDHRMWATLDELEAIQHARA